MVRWFLDAWFRYFATSYPFSQRSPQPVRAHPGGP